MRYASVDDMRALKEKKQRVLGFDIGDRRIGLSVSDALWCIASPLHTLDRTKEWRQPLSKIIKDYAIGGFVVGIPLLLNGDKGPQAQKVEAFVEKELAAYVCPILLWDERMSTHGATRSLLEADMSRRRRTDTVDKVAASFILQGVLDHIDYVYRH
jgi:putative Holliday junction resolvase